MAAEQYGIISRASMVDPQKKINNIGLLEAEKMPTDVGRPRHQLYLSDESLAEMPIPEFIKRSKTILRAHDYRQ